MKQQVSHTKPIKEPDVDHPIAIERNPNRVVVSVGGRVIADTRGALTLREAAYPPVQYVPRNDVDMTLLERTDHTTYCPYKGDCAYFSIPLGGERSVNAVWTYEDPYAAVSSIANHLAFYPDRVDALQEHSLDKTLSAAHARSSEITHLGPESQNKALVLDAFDTLFNKRDYVAAERFWSPNYVQHSAHIAPGREGLFNLVKGIPPTLRYEPGVIVADGDFVIVHGRFSGFGQPVNWIAADILRIQDGILVEHWDVIQDEASREQSKSGLPMFGDAFPK